MTDDELVEFFERRMLCGEKAPPEQREDWLNHVRACGGLEHTALGATF